MQDDELDGFEQQFAGPMETAVRAQLAAWQMDPAKDALAAAALDMATTLDQPDVNATPRSMLHAQFRMTMVELAKAAPVAKTHDGIDRVKEQREKRRGA